MNRNHVATKVSRRAWKVAIPAAFFALYPLLGATQGARDATSEAEAAQLMLDDQAIVEVAAADCKNRFPDGAASIDAWLAKWRASEANLVAAAELLNAKGPQTLAVQRRQRAEEQLGPAFHGQAADAAVKSFCDQLFAPGSQDRLRDSQPKTIEYLKAAAQRLQASGELKP